MKSNVGSLARSLALGLPGLLASGMAMAAGAEGPAVAGIPVDFILFALTLLGVALFHDHTLKVGLVGLTVISVYKLLFTGFHAGPGLGGLAAHFAHEWVTLSNLFLLLMGFALLARHFEKTRIPVILPRYLPDDWKGGFVLLVMVFMLLTDFLFVHPANYDGNLRTQIVTGVLIAPDHRRNDHLGKTASCPTQLSPPPVDQARTDVCPTRYLRNDRPRRERRANKPPLLLETEPPSSFGTGQNMNLRHSHRLLHRCKHQR